MTTLEQLDRLIKDIARVSDDWSVEERIRHTNHRLSVVDFWDPRRGSSVLELGCGHGDTTLIIAHVLGENGRILALDKASAEYGTPPIGLTQEIITSYYSKVTFKNSYNLLDDSNDLEGFNFDLVILSHSVWYFMSVAELSTLFAKLRPRCRKIGIAEWDIKPYLPSQMLHYMSVSLQHELRLMFPDIQLANVEKLISPLDIQSVLRQTGWQIERETTLNTSITLVDMAYSEAYIARTLVESLKDRPFCSDHLLRYFLKQVEYIENLMGNEVSALNTYVVMAS